MCDTNEFIRFRIQRLQLLKSTIGQSGTPVPTVRKRAFMSSRTQKAFQARRGKSLHTPKSVASVTRQVFSQTLKRCGRDAVKLHTYPKSVAGSGTQPQVSRRLFCFFFLRLKKEDTKNNPSVALRRRLPLLKGAFKLGLFVRTQGVFSDL